VLQYLGGGIFSRRTGIPIDGATFPLLQDERDESIQARAWVSTDAGKLKPWVELYSVALAAKTCDVD